jgi:hypothetical protein
MIARNAPPQIRPYLNEHRSEFEAALRTVNPTAARSAFDALIGSRLDQPQSDDLFRRMYHPEFYNPTTARAIMGAITDGYRVEGNQLIPPIEQQQRRAFGQVVGSFFTPEQAAEEERFFRQLRDRFEYTLSHDTALRVNEIVRSEGTQAARQLMQFGHNVSEVRANHGHGTVDENDARFMTECSRGLSETQRLDLFRAAQGIFSPTTILTAAISIDRAEHSRLIAMQALQNQQVANELMQHLRDSITGESDAKRREERERRLKEIEAEIADHKVQQGNASPEDTTRFKIEELGFKKGQEYNFNGVVVWRYTK